MDTGALREGQRLTAHNAFIMTAIYAGVIGLVITIVIIYFVFYAGLCNPNKGNNSLGMLLAFSAIIVNYFFGGSFKNKGIMCLPPKIFECVREEVYLIYVIWRNLKINGNSVIIIFNFQERRNLYCVLISND